MNSSIYNGTVIHKRFKPKSHFFKYSVFSLLIDLSELNQLDRDIKFFSPHLVSGPEDPAPITIL